MHFGIIAVKTDVAQLVEAFESCWPRHEPLARHALAGLEALDAWMRATRRQATATAGLAGNACVETFGFWQDGAWAVMLDRGYAHVSDPHALAALSGRFATALSFVIETSGSCAFFDAYDQGRRVRRIQSIDGNVTAEGAPLPQEADLAQSRYYTDETERLLLAFGITPPGRLPADKPVAGAAFVDRTDRPTPARAGQGPIRNAAAGGAAPVSHAERPWWRFW